MKQKKISDRQKLSNIMHITFILCNQDNCYISKTTGCKEMKLEPKLV